MLLAENSHLFTGCTTIDCALPNNHSAWPLLVIVDRETPYPAYARHASEVKHCPPTEVSYVCTTIGLGSPAMSLRLPAPAQSLVELDQCEQFITSSLRQAQLCVEQVPVGIQCIEQRIDTASVAHVGEL